MNREEIDELAKKLQLHQGDFIIGLYLNNAISSSEIEEMYGNEPAIFWKTIFEFTRQDKIGRFCKFNAFVLTKYFSDPSLGLDDLVYIMVEAIDQAQKDFATVINTRSSAFNALADEIWQKIKTTTTYDQKISLLGEYPDGKLAMCLADELVDAAKSDKRKLAKLIKASNSVKLGFKVRERLGQLLLQK